MTYELISWIGSFFLIVSYFLLSTDRIKQDDRLYHCMNLVGSTLFIIYSVSISANASIFINNVFAVIAVYSIIKISLKK